MKPWERRSFNTLNVIIALTGIVYFYMKYLIVIDDPFAVYVGMIVFGAVMTAIVILLLRLDWERILGRVAPWTLNDDEGDTT